MHLSGVNGHAGGRLPVCRIGMQSKEMREEDAMAKGGCKFTWLAGRGHGHKCNNPVAGHAGPHTCNCGKKR